MSHKSVYDQLKKYQSIPTAWNDWADYRLELTNWIIKETSPNSTAIIIGAGACNDYDLSRIASHFKKITLLDINETTMKCAVEKQISDEVLLSKINYITSSITGINEEDFRHFSDLLQETINVHGNATDINLLSSLAINEMQRAFATRNNSNVLLEKSYDYCLCFGVHSQINSMYPWVWEAYTAALGQTNTSVHQKAHEMNGYMIEELNDIILNTSVCGALLGLEETRFGIGGAVEGAWQGINDINARLTNTSIDLVSHQNSLWPFNPDGGVIYNIKWIHIKKK